MSSGYTREMHHDDCWRRRVSNAELASYPRQSCKSLRVHNGTAEIFARFTNVLVGVLIGILFITCHNARPQLSENGAERPILSATPNPVPAGDLDKPVGTTTITWDTGNGALGDLYVKVDREPEKFITCATSGRNEVRWIQFDSVYEFRLFNLQLVNEIAAITQRQ